MLEHLAYGHDDLMASVRHQCIAHWYFAVCLLALQGYDYMSSL